ncbi:hypothetical protein SLEP1_g59304 [Rubroshorea leprosula]|uniref:Uncharacterized protein n=1 Tax=Rubroshorea leprosula TaxID=152421 RepID=A0AAV5MT11_9ROSI|nr:hypothetical protein SLEP1_g59304 [Rubroshorea leprosula]
MSPSVRTYLKSRLIAVPFPPVPFPFLVEGKDRRQDLPGISFNLLHQRVLVSLPVASYLVEVFFLPFSGRSQARQFSSQLGLEQSKVSLRSIQKAASPIESIFSEKESAFGITQPFDQDRRALLPFTECGLDPISGIPSSS